MDNIKKRIKSYLQNHRQDMAETLSSLLRMPTLPQEPSKDAPYGIAIKNCLDAVLQDCAQRGFQTGNLDGYVGWCEYGIGEEMIGVAGHLDVVPAGAGWTETEPFSGEIKDDNIYGRGAIDDKGPLVAVLYALTALKESGFEPRRRIRLLFGTNEESGCGDMAYYRSHGGELPVIGFTPDGEYPLINGEKGIINGTYTAPLQQEENQSIRLRKLSGGTAANVCPDFAYAEVTGNGLDEIAANINMPDMVIRPIENGIRLEARGIAAHGSTPEKGKNAIGRLMMALAQFPLEGNLRRYIHFLAEKIGIETAGASLGIAMRDEVSGALTFNLGKIDYKEDSDSIEYMFSTRYPVTKEPDTVYCLVKKVFDDNRFFAKDLFHEKPLYMPPESELARTLCRVYEEETGEKAVPKCIGGGTYAKSLPNILAFGPIFPGDEVREHQPNEFIELERLVKNAEIYAAALYELAK